MAITEAYTGTATISTTAYSLPNNSTTAASITTDGVYQVFIDFNSLTLAEAYSVRVLEKVTSAGSQREVFAATVRGANPSFVSPSLILMHGWDVLVTKITGTDRSISWSIRQVA